MKALLLVGSLLCTLAHAADWPYFRGPDHTGTVTKDLFNGKPFGFKVAWKKDLGSGYACISVVGDTAVTMFSDPDNNLLAAYDTATGNERWRYVFGPVYKGHSGSQDGPTGTPTIHDGVVYAIDTYGEFVAVTLAEGKKLWHHKLGGDVKARVPHYGFNTVPMIIDDKVIVMTGDQEGRTFTAFNRKDGTEIWHSGTDTATYQSPIFQTVNGKQRIMAITDNYLMELNPDDGKVLWQAEHKIHDNETYALPVFAGKDRVVIQDRHQVAAFRLKRDGDTATMDELWRGPIFMRTYALPVYHEDHLYGFKSGFLTCVDAETGAVKWRSRPPGGNNLSLLDGQLIIIGRQGELVAVKATPEGYQESARVDLFNRGSYSAAVFANGSLYLRNLREMARVDLTTTQTLKVVEKPAPEYKGKYGEFFKMLEKSHEKDAMLEAFMTEHRRFPIIEGDNLVHYIYLGDVEDLGMVRGFEPEKPMHRVKGTDLFFFSEEVPADGHYEYHYQSFGDRIEDSLNPHKVGDARPRYELRMPKWQAPDYLGEPTGPRGKVVDQDIEGRKVKVYLPAGYETGNERYPVMVVANGDPILNMAKMDVALDNLIGKRIAPIIVAFVPGDRAELMGENQAAFANAVVNQVIPTLDKTYRTKADPAHRGLMGAGQGAVAAYNTAFHESGVFGKLALQSYVMLQNNQETHPKALAKIKPGQLSVFIEISTNDYDFPNLKAEESSRNLLKQLKEKGFSVTTSETAGSPGFGSWRACYGKILAWFAPK